MKQAMEPMGFVAERECPATPSAIQVRRVHLYVVPIDGVCDCGQPKFEVVGFHDPAEERSYFADARKRDGNNNRRRYQIVVCGSIGRLVE